MPFASRPHTRLPSLRKRLLLVTGAALGLSACGETSLETAASEHILGLGMDGGFAAADPESELDGSVVTDADAKGSLDGGVERASDSSSLTVSVIEDPPNSDYCKVSLRAGTSANAAELVLERFGASLDRRTAVATTSCIIAVSVVPPEGHTFALETITATGDASLPPGALASFSLSYGLNAVTSVAGSPSKSLQLRGPLEGHVEHDYTFAEGERTFWPCGEPVGVRLRLYLRLLNRGPERGGEISWTGLRLGKFVTRPCAQ